MEGSNVYLASGRLLLRRGWAAAVARVLRRWSASDGVSSGSSTTADRMKVGCQSQCPSPLKMEESDPVVESCGENSSSVALEVISGDLR